MTIATTEPTDQLPPLVLGWLAGQRSVHTRKAYLRDITDWLGWLVERGTDPLAVTEPDTAYWARHLEAAGLTASTVARKISAMSSWYRWLVRNGHMEQNPADNLARPEVDRDTSTTPGLTKDQTLALIAAADRARGRQRLRTSALVAVIMFSGARTSEVTGADIEDLGTDRGHRVLWVTRKGGKRQALVLPSPASERLNAYLASRPDVEHLPAVAAEGEGRSRRPLFVTKHGRRLFEANIRDTIQRLGRAAGLPEDLASRLGPHAVRHTYATLALDAGVPLRDLQDAMGHSDPRTTRRYDRARYTLDRSPGYLLASYLAPAEEEVPT
jgi:site-specific recombinase XerD